eukprot:SAG31_NODE_765_length_12248_cov_6.802947_9_plen_111_part_00
MCGRDGRLDLVVDFVVVVPPLKRFVPSSMSSKSSAKVEPRELLSKDEELRDSLEGIAARGCEASSSASGFLSFRRSEACILRAPTPTCPRDLAKDSIAAATESITVSDTV